MCAFATQNVTIQHQCVGFFIITTSTTYLEHEMNTTSHTTIKEAAEHAVALAKMACDNRSSSAVLCLCDAVNLLSNHQYEYAIKRALKSLAYSVGRYNSNYKIVEQYVSQQFTE
jgi:hypothetical protein